MVRRVSAVVKEDAVDLRFVLGGDGRDVGRYGKDDVKIGTLQDLGGPVLNPRGTGQRLTFGTVPIRAGVIRDALVTTGVALFDMPAEHGGAARLDRGHDAPLGGRQRPADLLPIGIAVAAEDVRHFERRAIHGPVA
jgi:hypothetical protein